MRARVPLQRDRPAARAALAVGHEGHARAPRARAAVRRAALVPARSKPRSPRSTGPTPRWAPIPISSTCTSADEQAQQLPRRRRGARAPVLPARRPDAGATRSGSSCDSRPRSAAPRCAASSTASISTRTASSSSPTTRPGKPPRITHEQGRLSGVNFYALLCERVLGRRPARVQLLYLSEPARDRRDAVRPEDGVPRQEGRRDLDGGRAGVPHRRLPPEPRTALRLLRVQGVLPGIRWRPGAGRSARARRVEPCPNLCSCRGRARRPVRPDRRPVRRSRRRLVRPAPRQPGRGPDLLHRVGARRPQPDLAPRRVHEGGAPRGFARRAPSSSPAPSGSSRRSSTSGSSLCSAARGPCTRAIARTPFASRSRAASRAATHRRPSSPLPCSPTAARCPRRPSGTASPASWPRAGCYVKIHHASDVVAGAAVGVALGVTAKQIWRRVNRNLLARAGVG